MRDPDTAKNSLTRSGGAVDFKPELNQLIDYLLDLIFTGRFLHCNNHECARLPRCGELETARRRGGKF